MRQKLFLMTLLLLTGLLGARAQQELPYTYGFENGNLTADGWEIQGATNNNTGLFSNSSGLGEISHGGSNFFLFYYLERNAYLLSPILTGGDNGVDVSFWYSEYSSTYGDEQFQVGYTTDETVTDASAFTYGDVVTASTDWQQYQYTFPAGTKRIAIQYIYNDTYFLILDDFSFDSYSAFAKPTDLSVSNLTTNSVTIGWTAPEGEIDGYAYQYKIATESQWSAETTVNSTSVTLNGLTPARGYIFRVKAKYSDGESGYATVSFTTDCPETYAIPYSYGFEDAEELNCWTIDGDIFVDEQDVSFARTGNNFCFFYYTQNPPQYLISPLLSGIVNGLHVEFYYSQYTQGVETFQVGYSTTDNDPDSFTWGEEITATTSYQRFSANYPAETKYVAVKHTSDYQYYLFLDDFLFEEAASVLEPTGVHVAEETTTSATISWTAGGDETAWDLYITDDETDVPDETTTPTVASTSDNPYSLTGLTPATYYYVYVRANAGSEVSAWSSPAVFNTKAEPITLPYSYDFEDDMLPIGWTAINSNTSYNNVSIMDVSAVSRGLAFYIASSTGTVAAVLPEVDAAYSLNGYQVSFDACYANSSYTSMTSGKIAIGIMTDPEDIATFELIEEIDINDEYSTFGSHTVSLENYTGSGQYIAIQNIYTQSGYILIDNIAVTELPSTIELADNATDNSTIISQNNGKLVNVKLAGRTLYKDEKWNTLCLPFDVTLAGSPLEGATAKTLESVDIDGENVKLTFGVAVSTLKAGTPYIIKWAESTEHIVEPEFVNVTINKRTNSYSEEDDDGNIFMEFKGYYDAFDVQANNKNIWYLTSGNKLKYTAENRTLKACRAYFWFDDVFFSNTARSFVLDFGEGGISTSVDSLPAELTGEGEWFSVDGRKLGNAPTKKGVYLNNGKKIVVK